MTNGMHVIVPENVSSEKMSHVDPQACTVFRAHVVQLMSEARQGPVS